MDPAAWEELLLRLRGQGFDLSRPKKAGNVVPTHAAKPWAQLLEFRDADMLLTFNRNRPAAKKISLAE